MNKKKASHLYNNLGFWYIRYKDPNTQKWKSVSTKLKATQKNKKEAADIKNLLIDELDKFEELQYREGCIVDSFEHFKEINENKSESTKSTYQMFYNYLTRKFPPDTPCITIKKKNAEEFLLWLGKLQNINQNTKYGIQKNFLKFIRFLAEYEYIPHMFIINKDVKISPKIGEPIIFSDKDRKTILESLDLKSKNNNFQLLIYLLLYTGLRPSDIINITTEQIDIERMEMKFYSSKIDKWFVRPLHSILKEKLSKRIDEVKTGKLFDYSDIKNMGKAVQRFLKELNLLEKGYNLRTFRKDFISRCQESGIQINTASFLVGHSNIKTTMTYYTKLSTKHLKNELTKLK